MPENVRDLAVSISLNSENFSKNVKTLNGQIREVESQFKAAGAGVSDFEHTIDGAQAKAEMLAKKVELQSRAVEQYEKALSAAEAKLNQSYAQHEKLSKALDDAKARYDELVSSEGENSDAAKEQAAEVRKLEGQLQAVDRQLQNNVNSVASATSNLNNARAALNTTQAALNDANSELQKQSSAWQKAADVLDSFSEKAQDAGKKMTSAGKTLSMGLTAPITALAAASYKSFSEVDDGLDTIITKTGATGKALEDLNKSYETIFRSMPVDAADAAVAIGEVNTRFKQTGQELEDTSKLFLQFAKINGLDLNSSIDDVDTLMTKFGVDTSEVAGVLGYLTKVSQDTGISIGALMSSLKSNGSSLKELGLGLDESITLLAQFEENGVDAGTALTGLKKAVQEAAKDGKDANTAITETMLAIRDAKDDTEALQIAMELFGSRGAAEMVSAIREGRISIDQLGASMSKYSSVVSDTYEATLDLPDQATVALNNLKVAGKELASSAMSMLAPVAETLISKVQGLVDAFQALDEGTKQRIVKIAALVALVGPALTLVGKLTSTVGLVTGAIGKFAASVAAAGGGLSGLGSVLLHSPALWMAVAAAVAYGTYKLIDYVSGAKATREAIEKMETAAKSWKDTAATTFYTTSKGLDAFGISASAFHEEAKEGYKWLNRLQQEWSDELVETDETVTKYVDSFKSMTGSTREALQELANEAYDNGYDPVYNELMAKIGELDLIDSRVEQLLKKRKESYLTAEDIEELNELIAKREEIEVAYHLVDADEGDGFQQITDSIEAAKARANALGEEVSISVYEDALVASAQGLKELNASIDEQYDSRYKLVQMITDETERTKAQAELDVWYSEERAAALRKYADTAAGAFEVLGESDKIKQTAGTINDLYDTIDRYNHGQAGIEELAEFTESLDEDDIAEYYSYMTQLYDLLDKGFTMDDISAMTGLDPATLEQAFFKLEAINSELGKLDSHAELDPLREMFGESLSEEIIKFATDLDMTGAKARWEEFAANPGSPVFTNGLIKGYTVSPSARTNNINPQVTGTITSITGENKTIPVTGYSIDPFTGTLTAVTGNGETITCTNYTLDPMTGTITAATPEGDTITITGNYKAYVHGTLSDISGDNRSFNVTDVYATADGHITAVTADGKTFVLDAYTVTGDGYITGTTTDGKTFTLDQGTVTAKADVTLSDLDTATITAWYTRNAGKVKLDTRVNATVKTTFGKGSKVTLTDLADEGLLKLYGEDGIEIPVTPKAVGELSGSDLVIGTSTDKDGNTVYHIQVKPEWVMPGEDDMEDAGRDLADKVTKAVEEVEDKTGMGDFAAKAAAAGAVRTGKWGDYGVTHDEAGIFGYMFEGVSFMNGKIGQLLSWMGVLDDSANMAAEDVDDLASAVAGVSYTYTEGIAPMESYSGAIVDFMRNTADAVDELNKSGDGIGIVSALIDELAKYGINVKASDLPQYLRDVAKAIELEGKAAEGADMAATALAGGEMTARSNEAFNARRTGGNAAPNTEALDTLVGVYREIADVAQSGDLEKARAQYDALKKDLEDSPWAEWLSPEQTDFQSQQLEALETYLNSFATETVPDIAESSANADGFQAAGEMGAQGFASGLDIGTDSVVAAAGRMAAAAVAAAKAALVIRSPSHVFRDEVGLMAMRGFGEGIIRGSKEQARIVRNAASYLTDEARGAVISRTTSAVYNYSYSSPIDFGGATFAIRDQTDIYTLAREIAALTRRQQRGNGVR